MSRQEILIALEEGHQVENDNGTRFISIENVAGGKYVGYCCEDTHPIPALFTNDLDEAIAFIL